MLGEVTESQLKIARHADAIFIEEIISAGLYDDIAQAYAALLPVRAVGVAGDKRVYSQVVRSCPDTCKLLRLLILTSLQISLRAVQTTDFMTADFFYPPKEFIKKVSLRITNEVEGVSRVVYDLTSKPPGKQSPRLLE